MKFAVLTTDEKFVDNVIVAREDQKEELESVLNRTLVEANYLGLQIGDYYNGANWTRNIDGEQVILPLDENPDVTEAISIVSGGEY